MINVYSYKALIKEYPPEKFSYNVSPPFYIPDANGLCSNWNYIVNGFYKDHEGKVLINLERVLFHE